MDERDSELEQLLAPVRKVEPEEKDFDKWFQKMSEEHILSKRVKRSEWGRLWQLAAMLIIGIGIGWTIAHFRTVSGMNGIATQSKSVNQDLFAIKYYCN